MKVKAFDGAGHFMEASQGLTIDTIPPQAPNLRLNGNDGGKVTLSWNDVENGDDYIVLYGTNPGNYPYAKRFGDVTSASIEGLNNGPYYFVVKAEDKAKNASGDSNEVSTATTSSVNPGVGGTATPTGPAPGFAPTAEVLGTDTQTQVDKNDDVLTSESQRQGEVLGATTSNVFTWWWIALLFYAIMMLITYVMVSENTLLRLLGNILATALASYLLTRWLPQPLPWIGGLIVMSSTIESLWLWKHMHPAKDVLQVKK